MPAYQILDAELQRLNHFQFVRRQSAIVNLAFTIVFNNFAASADSYCTQVQNFSSVEHCAAEFIVDDQHIRPASFSRRDFVNSSFWNSMDRTTPNFGKTYRPVIDAQTRFKFQMLLSFETNALQRQLWSKSDAIFRLYRGKNLGQKWAKFLSQFFSARSRTQPLMYF